MLPGPDPRLRAAKATPHSDHTPARKQPRTPHPGQRSYLPDTQGRYRRQPKSADLIATEPTAVLPWERAVFADARVYWLATVPPAGRPRRPPIRL